jgi:primosomal protein N' (replication factor Y) (superfamily II helicase)
VLYAKIVLALPVEGPFDYQLSPGSAELARPGMRAWVNFRGKKEIGYIVGISPSSDIPRVKPIIKLIDTVPVLGPELLKLTRMLADHYCCSYGEAIAASLPQPIRKGKPLEGMIEAKERPSDARPEGLLLLDLDGLARWEIYSREIRETLSAGKSAIVLACDKTMVLRSCQMIGRELGPESVSLSRQQPNEIPDWIKIVNGQIRVVYGTRSSIFAPVTDLGLIIVDEELDPAYKQDQVPHYHARQVALMRSKLQKTRLILGGSALSLESFYLSQRRGFKLQVLPRKSQYPEIKIVEMKNLPLLDKKKNIILSRLLQDAIVSVLSAKGKILLFLNRRGFATAAACSTCGQTLKCPRCNTNLVYFYNQNALRCQNCNFKLLPPKICPQCKSGYIKFSGAGTEKIESELSRIFPQAKIKRIDTGEAAKQDDADIFISTLGFIHQADFRFELTAVLAIDNLLNQVDFRSSEKVFAILLGLLAITDKKMFVQTSLSSHYCFKALEQNDIRIFYEEELKSRRQVKFPPYRNFCQVRLRGKNEEKVAEAAKKLFDKLSAAAVAGEAQVVSLNPGQPPKLRGNYYWVILLSAINAPSLNKFLKINLKDFRYSGIIITVDVDPV